MTLEYWRAILGITDPHAQWDHANWDAFLKHWKLTRERI